MPPGSAQALAQQPIATPAQGTHVPPNTAQASVQREPGEQDGVGHAQRQAEGPQVSAVGQPPSRSNEHAQEPRPQPAPARLPHQQPPPAQTPPPHPGPASAPQQSGTPAQGTHLPSAGAAPQPGTAAPPSAPQPAPEHHPNHPDQPGHPHNPGPPAAPWQHYDPWRVPAGAPLLHPVGPGGGLKERRGRRRGLLVLGAVALALVAGGIGGGMGAYWERNGGVGAVELPQTDKESRDRAPDSVAGIAASALPGVVTLHVNGGGAQGTGTGFVLDKRGHILTNNHVVEPAGSGGAVTVTFSGGETAKGRVVGRDSGYDLAVVKVTAVSGLKPLPLGNSENVQVGDPVVAIGAPFDLSNTVTSGIISAKERPITAGGEDDGSDISYVNALQTDAPINPGNSGGPLVDSEARVIGINSAIRSAGSGADQEGGGQSGSIGLGFAIPVNQAKRVAEELINDGRATHPVIEVTLDTRYNGDGARVAEKGANGSRAVTRNGPGDKAGIEPGDVITEVDGQRVHSGEELIVKIRAHEPGDKLKLTLERSGNERSLALVLGASHGD
ncbi:putative serine protease HhoB precursor [Streptomyces sp. YIM 130001]|uniref:S1C family serine protease n=1 Tax=Streptomyces sp. YIM 130001 TaxID=2259644 RepID=UPI000E64E0E7|nr:trypsin-like peptidase domain-containing protein [Streptomyces sp. YIM 130001]RII16168.1 putative serine protease HhoB precursor [Streptomyces sp. YIM 130001]